jgi:hypothetical protein
VHMVFTLPHQLGRLALHNKKVVYTLLFRASAATLLESQLILSTWERRSDSSACSIPSL